MADGDRSGLKLIDGVLVVGAAVIAVVVAFALLHFIAGLIWLAVKVVVVVAFLGAIVWLLLRRRS